MTTQPTRVLIVGAGAIGGWFAHRLATAGHDVTVVGRPQFVAAVREQGIGLAEAGMDQMAFVTNLQAISDLREIAGQSFDLVTLTMKAYDVEPAIADLQRHGITWRWPLLLIQNGVGTEEQVTEILGPGSAACLSTTRAMTQVAPGQIRMESAKGGVVLAPTAPGQSIAEAVDLFAGSGFQNVLTHDDYRAVRWSKMIMNLVGGAQSAILDWTPPRMYQDRRLVGLTLETLRETLAVMRALGVPPIELPSYPIGLLVTFAELAPTPLAQPILQKLVAKGRGDRLPAVQQDLRDGRKRLEAEVLNGAVSRFGQQAGVDTPVNDVIVQILAGITSGQIDWEDYKGQPERLLQAVAARRKELGARPKPWGPIHYLRRRLIARTGR